MMAERSHAAVLEAVGKISIRPFGLPAVGRNDGLLRVERAGVCASDTKRFHGVYKSGTLPLIMGHEILGRVEAAGQEAAARWGVEPGDRVLVEASIPCHHCGNCQKGCHRFCVRRRIYGASISADTPPHLWGAYSEFMYLDPDTVLHKISKEIPADAALLAGPIANGIRWVRTAGGCHIGDTVVVQGVGPQGLSAIIAAREAGAETIIATGLHQDEGRFGLARELGAHYTVNVQQQGVVEAVREITRGRMADLVVDVTGSPQALQASVDLLREMGTLVSGGLTGTDTLTPLPMDKITLREIRVLGVFTADSAADAVAIRLVESRKYPIEKMVTDLLPLGEIERALRLVGGEAREYPVKVALAP